MVSLMFAISVFVLVLSTQNVIATELILTKDFVYMPVHKNFVIISFEDEGQSTIELTNEVTFGPAFRFEAPPSNEASPSNEGWIGEVPPNEASPSNEGWIEEVPPNEAFPTNKASFPSNKTVYKIRLLSHRSKFEFSVNERMITEVRIKSTASSTNETSLILYWEFGYLIVARVGDHMPLFMHWDNITAESIKYVGIKSVAGSRVEEEGSGWEVYSPIPRKNHWRMEFSAPFNVSDIFAWYFNSSTNRLMDESLIKEKGSSGTHYWNNLGMNNRYESKDT